MEDACKFKKWLDDTIKAGKKELNLTDSTLFHILATEALHIALKMQAKGYLEQTERKP